MCPCGICSAWGRCRRRLRNRYRFACVRVSVRTGCNSGHIAGVATLRWLRLQKKRTVKTKFPRQRAGRTPPLGRPATLAHSGRSPGHPTRMKNNRRVNLYVVARSQRGPNEFCELQPLTSLRSFPSLCLGHSCEPDGSRLLRRFAGGGSGLTAARTINRTAILHSGRTPGAVATFDA